MVGECGKGDGKEGRGGGLNEEKERRAKTHVSVVVELGVPDSLEVSGFGVGLLEAVGTHIEKNGKGQR